MSHNLKRMNKVNFIRIIPEMAALLFSLVILIPYIMVILGSFKDLSGAAQMNLKFPDKWYIVQNYAQTIEKSNIVSGFFNSLIDTLGVVTLITLLASLTAFIIQRRNDKLSKFILAVFLMGIVMPTNIVTLVLMLKKTGMGNMIGLVLTQTAGGLAFSIIICIGYLKGIPRDIDEYAYIEGCGPIRLFSKIILPLIKPIIVTLIVINSMGIWNDFITPLYLLNNPQQYTIALSIYYFIGEMGNNSWNLIFADIVIISMPIILLYLLMQRHIEAGLTYGAVKG